MMSMIPIAMRRGTRASSLRLLLLAGVAITLSGCYTAREKVFADNTPPTDYRKRHPITVREGNRTVELFVGTNRGGLTPSQRAEIVSFAQNWRHDGTGGMVIEIPSGTPNEAAANDVLRDIRALLAAAGVPPYNIAVRGYQPADPARLATVKLNYPKMIAEAGPCGLWPDDLGPGGGTKYLENTPYYNLGCSNQRNLAAMIDNPADLVQPRGETPVYAARRNTMFDKYKKGTDPATQYPNSDKAKLSDLAK